MYGFSEKDFALLKAFEETLVDGCREYNAMTDGALIFSWVMTALLLIFLFIFVPGWIIWIAAENKRISNGVQVGMTREKVISFMRNRALFGALPENSTDETGRMHFITKRAYNVIVEELFVDFDENDEVESWYTVSHELEDSGPMEAHLCWIEVPLGKRDEIFERCFCPGGLIRNPTDDLANALVDLARLGSSVDFEDPWAPSFEHARNNLFKAWRKSAFMLNDGVVELYPAVYDWELLLRLAQGISILFPKETIRFYDYEPTRNTKDVAYKIKDGKITDIHAKTIDILRQFK